MTSTRSDAGDRHRPAGSAGAGVGQPRADALTKDRLKDI
jgi:hypothetical protein